MINFPSGPSVGDQYTFANKTWEWNGTTWSLVTANTAGNNLQVLSIQSNEWIDLFSSNVIENTNLFYTNARARTAITVIGSGSYDNTTGIITISGSGGAITSVAGVNVGAVSNIQIASGIVSTGLLTTANIVELSNLFYTNARVYSNVLEIGFATNLYLNNQLSSKANVVDLTTSNVTELTNLYYTNARVYSNVIGLLNLKSNIVDLTTSNIVEGNNLYYTNARVYSNVIGLLNLKSNIVDLTTDNVYELTNLYYTNARVYSNIISLLDLKANVVDLTTSNVFEDTNLYYTNARVRSALETGNGIVYDNITGNISLSPTGVIQSTYGGEWYLPILDIDEFGRVTSAANLLISNINSFTSAGNLFTIFTSDGNSFTANIQENSIRLSVDTVGDYLENVIAGTGVVISNQGGEQASPIISIGQNVSSTADVTFANIIITGNLTVLGNSLLVSNSVIFSDPLIQVGKYPSGDSVDLGFFGHYIGGVPSVERHTGFFRDATDGQFKLFTNLVIEPNLTVDYDANSFELADLVLNTLVGNVTGLVSSIVNHTTTSLAEGLNLYFTNTRVYSNVIPLLNLKANVADLTTSNILELTNLFYSNDRVYSNVIGLLNTKANVVDLLTTNITEGINLYYTNARVYSNISPLLTTANITELTSLYYSNDRVYSNISPLLTTANIAELTSLYYSNDRVYSNISPLLTTANITELTNLYYSNSRVYSNVIPLLNLKANVVDLTTTNVAELTNLYYTNARVYSNISPLLTTSNIAELTNLYYTNDRVFANVFDNLSFLTTNIIPEVAGVIHIGSPSRKIGNLYVKNLFVDPSTIVLGNLSIKDQGGAVSVTNPAGDPASVITDSGNVVETSQLFFTNARVYANVIGLLNLKANVLDLFTTNVAEGINLYYTNTRVYSNISPLLTTANIAELTNLYYTNARVRSTLESGNGIVYNNVTGNITLAPTGVINKTYGGLSNVPVIEIDRYGRIISASNIFISNVNSFSSSGNLFTISTSNGDSFTASLQENSVRLGVDTTGNYLSNVIAGTGVTITNQGGEGAAPTIAIGQDVSDHADVTFANVTITGNILVLGNSIVFNANSLAIKDPLIQVGTNPTGDSVDLGFFGHYIENALEKHAGFFRDASDGNFKLFTNLYPEPNVTVSTGDSTYEYANLYIKNLIGNVTGIVSSIYNHTTTNLSEGINLYYTNARVYSNISPLLTTANIAELTNLYYTNARVYSNVIGLLNLKSNIVDLTTSNVYELTNLYYTNARVYSNVIGLLNLKANVVDLTTSNILELNNLYYTNARVYSNVIGLLNLKANIVDLTTSNVAELNNLYYTNARVYSNIIGPLNLKANIVDLTTANTTELNNLYYTNARVYSNVIGLLNLKANIADLTTANTTELNNLYYTNARSRAAISNTNGIGYVENTGVISLVNTGVISGTYGNSTIVPIITVDDQGRITNVSNVNISISGGPGGGAVDSVNGETGVVVLSTANISESGNLYYTNARVRTALISGNGISYSNTTGNITLSPTGVTANTYGNTFLIPRITVDAYGRITTVTTASTNRVVSIADGTSITMNADTTDVAVQINTQVAGTLTINAPTGTPADGQKLTLRIQSTNAQTFSFNSIFSGSTDLSLPTSTSGASKYDYLGFMYSTAANKWHFLAKTFGF